jgi:hypothetical protein
MGRIHRPPRQMCRSKFLSWRVSPVSSRKREEELDLLTRRWSKAKTGKGQLVLLSVYGWFTEGFDTRDLNKARALLSELAQGARE